MAKPGFYNYHTVGNRRYPTTFPAANVEFALKYTPKESDKFLVSYAKSGSNWTLHIMSLILNNGVLQYRPNGFQKNLLELSGKQSLEKFFSQDIIKCELPFNQIPYSKSAKYLLLVRNPKDVCVSYYYHMKNDKNYEFDGDFHDFFRLWINAEYHLRDYFDHLLSYWSHRFDDNFSFLVYEHMKKNTKEAVLTIGKFLGDEFVKRLEENDGFLLNEVVKNSSIDAMRMVHGTQRHVRKGIVGDWRNHFNKEESDLIDRKVKQYFTGTGLEELWAQDMKW